MTQLDTILFAIKTLHNQFILFVKFNFCIALT